MRYSLGALAALVALTGCAMSTGILPAGADTYALTERFAPARGGAITAQRSATDKATAFCAQQGRQFVPLEMVTPADANEFGPTTYSVTFRCLLPEQRNR